MWKNAGQSEKPSFKFWSRVNAIKSRDIWNKAIRVVPNWKSNIPFRVPNSRTVPLESEWRESSRILRGCRNLVGFNFRNAQIHMFFYNFPPKRQHNNILTSWLYRSHHRLCMCTNLNSIKHDEPLLSFHYKQINNRTVCNKFDVANKILCFLHLINGWDR